MEPRPAGRPIGVAVVAGLALTAGIVGGLTGLSALIGAGPLVATGVSVGAIGPIVGVLALLLGAASFLLAYGSWRLRAWAHPLGLVIEPAIAAVVVLQGLFVGGGLVSLVTLVGVAIPVVILGCLATPVVRAALGRTAADGPASLVDRDPGSRRRPRP